MLLRGGSGWGEGGRGGGYPLNHLNLFSRVVILRLVDSYRKLSRCQMGFAAFSFVMNTIYPPQRYIKERTF